MQLGSLDDGVGGEYNCVHLVEVSEIFVTQDDFFYTVASFDRKNMVSFPTMQTSYAEM